MQLDNFQYYLIIINIVAFMISTIDSKIYSHRGKGIKIQALCKLVTALGGALGAVIAGVLWGSSCNKQNAKALIHSIIWLTIQVVFLLALYGPYNEEIMLWVENFYSEYNLFCIYLILINIVTFFLFALDKVKAMMGLYRIREAVLLGLSLLGGSVGGLLAMDVCHHKVKTTYFLIGLPVMLITQIIVILYSFGIFEFWGK